MGKRRKTKEFDRGGYRDRDDSYSQFEQNEYERTENNIRNGVQPKTLGQKHYIHEIINNDITICQGPAGTGKSLVAIGMGIQSLLAKGSKFKKIVLMRPVKEACDESIGYLPGSMDEKMAPWAAPIVDNLLVFLNQKMIENLFRMKKIEVIPLAFARGRSLNNSFIILDEAQNCTDKQMLMALTRIGEDSKMVITGDISQNDHSNGKITGLEDAINRLHDMPNVGIVELEESDIVRNPMIGEIIRRYSN